MTVLKEDLEYIANYDLPYENLKGRTVLVTGATGLIGVSLVRALLAIGDIKILAFVRNEEKARKIYGEDSNVELVIGNITNPICVSGEVEYIFHCASVTATKVMIEKPLDT